jgi:hypothetical protein
MNTEQTRFDTDGLPLGKAITDCQTGAVTFQPHRGYEALAKRTFCSRLMRYSWQVAEQSERQQLASMARMLSENPPA